MLRPLVVVVAVSAVASPAHAAPPGPTGPTGNLRDFGVATPAEVVAVRNPYEVAHTAAPTWLATHSPGPVAVPGPTPHPFGHGTGW